MAEIILTIIKESILGSLGVIKSLAIVIIPLMILIQIMTEYKLIERLSNKTKFITDFLGVSKDTLIPLLIGMLVGISYGAGAIIDAKDRYDLSNNDIFLVMCFLVPFHGIIEISLIFWVIGVNPVIIIIARLFVAIPVTLFFKKQIAKKEMQELKA
ncbi:MAG TPA: nucleoside recognition domain-containing protein [Anaerovoracaceae bacterium]|nr:nucleoside recognition domain-containing protein [Anaerovoracaceae bacterium]